MPLPKVAVSVVLPVGHDDWSAEQVKWALCSVASQDWPRWRLHVVDATRGHEVRSLAEGIIPEHQLEYSVASLRGDSSLSSLLYEAMCGIKAKYVAYILPNVCWYPDHLTRLMTTVGEGADVVFMTRKRQFKLPPDRLAIEPGAAALWGILHKTAHYERTPGFQRADRDPALTLMQGFHGLLDTAWHPIIAHIRAPAALPLNPGAGVPLGAMKVTQLQLFQHV